MHPFFGITFLVCKKAKLPVGAAKTVPINAQEEDFLRQHYRPELRSRHFYSPFRISGGKSWLVPKYPYAGSQSTRTRGDFARAFIHPKDTSQWGFSKDYLDVLEEKLRRDKTGLIPSFWLATWLFRERTWPQNASAIHVQETFYSEYLITSDERKRLFTDNLESADREELFSPHPYTDTELLKNLPRAPDVAPEEGGTLRSVVMRGIGPAEQIIFKPGERMTIATGDNGLGKTFLLEACWWSLTSTWAERPLQPRLEASSGEPTLEFEVASAAGRVDSVRVKYDWQVHDWSKPKRRPLLPGLVVYARVDGSFAVFDPARHSRAGEGVRFSRSEVLYGLEGQIEGLIRDWVNWQRNPDRTLFETFTAVLRALSPPELPLEPGQPVRLPNEAREIPTLYHAYGIVPFIQESAAIRRVAAIAYLLVWTWNEHRIAAALSRRPLQPKLVFLIDEVEAHLHPKWQRIVVPAILKVANILSREVEPQLIVATHSPLVLASVETHFDEDRDKLFHLQIADGDVSFDEVPYVRYGSVDRWLVSDIFELKQARSTDAEESLEEARRVMLAGDQPVSEVTRVTELLRGSLPSDDEFWPRWLHFAESRGVML